MVGVCLLGCFEMFHSNFQALPGISSVPYETHLDVSGHSLDPGVYRFLDPEQICSISAEDTVTQRNDAKTVSSR